MSDKILKALMQLFAIIANAERLTLQGRNIVENFLRQQLSLALVQTYLTVFDEYLLLLQGKADEGKVKKRVSVNSVKVLRICTEINSELNQKQKYIVLLRLIEFAYSSHETVNEQEGEFLATVANVFNISTDEFEDCVSFCASRDITDIRSAHRFLLITNSSEKKLLQPKHILNETLEGDLCVLHIKSAGILFVKYFGYSLITLNGHPLLADTAYVFSPGSVIRGTKAQPVYYSDVMRTFLEDESKSEINLSVNNVEYVFSNKKKGLNNISFTATSGNLIGIMGGSGAGKSTLLNILNSNLSPAQGEVLINGINIHTECKKLEGVIGFVPQDDLLMEDLTVYQNLFYNSKLCFGNLTDAEITKKVHSLMETLGLFEIRDLKVGDVLNKTISGGQRKRLNIALELIRTPSILFVDEPTSGLSSLDSENVMDLLKQLSISGKLVFVVIHQPSSDIFKLFDKLLILDIGGYPIYYGNPVDSLIYFKTHASYANATESECETCGNINPEQVFSIIESKVIDEFGNPTALRKFSPSEWNDFYKENIKVETNQQKTTHPPVTSDFKKPSRFQQLMVFIKRDILSKLHNTQYLLINFLEAPLLAFILAYFLKYFKDGGSYIFRDNQNLTAYIFMSVIVALFMGLTVSAEEIIRDRKILKREAFLNLSRSSYLLSKISVMFLISAIQTFSFVAVGNYIFGIRELFFDYWLVLFSVSCFSNLMGLNISSAFDSVVTIYILIPFLIIPQIILSGVMVSFEKLNPAVTSQNKVPLIGEIMASRWAFEALAINQFKNNSYQKHFFEVDKEKSNSSYMSNLWMQKMNDKLDSLHKKQYGNRSLEQFQLLKNELEKEANTNGTISPQFLNQIRANNLNDALYNNIKGELARIKKLYTSAYNNAVAKRDKIVKTLANGNDKIVTDLHKNYTNKDLDNWLLGMNNLNIWAVDGDGEIIRHAEPVYMQGAPNSFIRTQFYVSSKNVFGKYFDTYWVNFFILWLMSALLSITLYFNLLKKLLRNIGSLFTKR